MKVAFDVSPLKTGHNFRGIGSYTLNLKDALCKQKTPFELEFVENQKDLDKYQLIHHPYFDLFFHTLPIKSSIKRIVTIHDVTPLIFPNHFPSGIRGNISLFQQRLALRHTNWIICDSKNSKNDIANKFNYPASQITPIYLAASNRFREIKDTKSLAKISRKYNLPPSFALYVGDVNWNKNVEGLINAISISKKPLVLIGKALTDENLIQSIQINNLVKKLKIEDLIIKTGFVKEEDLVSIYNLATVTVLPSFYEGFGLPAIESMACGTPVVCSNNSSLSEITTSDTAIYCDPENPQDIADKIKEAFQIKDSSRKSLAVKLQQHSSKFTWDRVAKETISVYLNVLKK